MNIKDVMSKNADWISPETTLAQAAQKMKAQDIGFLPVGENDKLIGTVTDRDIVVRALAENMNPQTTTVKDVMTAKMLYCFDDQGVDEICDNMAQMKVRRFPVVNRDKRQRGENTDAEHGPHIDGMQLNQPVGPQHCSCSLNYSQNGCRCCRTCRRHPPGFTRAGTAVEGGKDQEDCDSTNPQCQ